MQFEIKYGEKLYGGRYLFEDGELWVASNWGNKFTAAHALTADCLARILLREIIDEATVRNEIECGTGNPRSINTGAAIDPSDSVN